MTTELAERACPIVVRKRNECLWSLLAFKHPLAGLQLVKGRIETDETPESAARRELLEESGLVATSPAEFLCIRDDLPDTGIWHFYLCDIQGVLPETWSFETRDDGGQCFQFFWHPFDAPVSRQWHPLYRDVLSTLLPNLKTRLSNQHY